MTETLFVVVGGIGLFLLGMVLLTDGLKSMAGDTLRKKLVQFTGGPVTAFLCGTVVTALLQSSSATTVMVIGFVSAGLLTFPQSIGVVIGASVGTTCTGWIVALLGLQLSVGFYALPLVGIGAFLNLLGRGRWRAMGTAVAGFGLILLGMGTLRDGMQGISGEFTLAHWPHSAWIGRLLMVLAGVLFAVAMQSSSAAVMTTLTALHAGSVNFEQATSLVIGAAMGTTVTAALAAIGANVPARRTALAHVLFNLATGAIALALLPLFLEGIEAAQHHLGLEPGAMSLAAFHTAFISLGAAAFLPLVARFSHLIEWLLPQRAPVLTQHLDNTVLHVPAVALEATRRSLSETACALFGALDEQLESGTLGEEELPLSGEIAQALERTQQFLARVPPVGAEMPESRARVAQMHAIDHLLRLHSHLRPPATIVALFGQELVRPFVARVREVLALAQTGMRGTGPDRWLSTMEQVSAELADKRRRERPGVFLQTASGACEPAVALDVLDAMRWLDRLAYHSWRICNYLAGDCLPEPPAPKGQPLED